jgi:hypothetical protein
MHFSIKLVTSIGLSFFPGRYSLTPQGPIRTKTPSPDNRAYRPPGPIIGPDFESENGFGKVLQLATKLVQVGIDQSYSLTPQGPIRTKTPSPDTVIWNTWRENSVSPLRTDGVAISMNFEKELPLATKLVQVVIDKSYSLIPQGPISTKSPSQIIGPTGPWTNYRTDFESENGFEKVSQLATELVQVAIEQSYWLTPQGPIRPIPR